MLRNLDLTALRSFVAVADEGGVTRAAGSLNLTQSAVSMQLKRLEEGLGLSLLDRSARQIGLTPEGEQLLSFARRMLVLNDEALRRLTAKEFEGEVTLGVPHDIVYPAVPAVLQAFAARHPRMKVNLVSSFTRALRDQFERGEVDVILTTEQEVGPGAETLASKLLVWVGAPDGQAWRQRPLRIAHESRCIFRGGVVRSLDDAGIPWESAVQTESSRTIEATVSADLAVHTMLEGSVPAHLETVEHGGALPQLQRYQINLYRRGGDYAEVIEDMAELLRAAYRKEAAPATSRPPVLMA